MKTLRPFETWGKNNPGTKHHTLKDWILNYTDVVMSNFARPKCCYSGIHLENIAVETVLLILRIRKVLRGSARRPSVRAEFFSLLLSPSRQMYIKCDHRQPSRFINGVRIEINCT